MEPLTTFVNFSSFLTPQRLYRALPAVLLGTLFNILDAGEVLLGPPNDPYG